MEWTTRGRGNYSYDTMCQAIKDYVNEEPHYQYHLIVGTDSQNHFFKGGAVTKFVTAVVVRRVGKGGQYYVKKWDERYISSLRQKIYTEAISTIVFLDQLKETFAEEIGAGLVVLQPDADVGMYGKTKELVNEIIGMFKSGGYDNVKIKPDSFCSSTIADRHSK